MKTLVIRSAGERILQRCLALLARDQCPTIDLLSDRPIPDARIGRRHSLEIGPDRATPKGEMSRTDYGRVVILVDPHLYSPTSYRKFIALAREFRGAERFAFVVHGRLHRLEVLPFVWFIHRARRGLAWLLLGASFSPLRMAAAIASALLHLIRPLLPIRFIDLYTSRIGHLAHNTDVFLRYKRHIGDRTIWIGMAEETVANRTMLAIIRRRMPVLSHRAGVAVRSTRLMAHHAGSVYDYSQYWRFRGWEKVPRSFSLSHADIGRGNEELERLGIDSWYVCFHSRDTGFLAAREGYTENQHDYRDCSIENYLPAMTWIAEQGGYAIRMGEVVSSELPANLHPRVIDYAKTGRSDFMDVFLPVTCRFYVGCTSGLLAIPTVFETSIIPCNLVPLEYFSVFKENDLCLPKLYRSRRENRLLTFREIIASGAGRWHGQADFDRAGVECVETSADEILEAVKEMHERLEGRYVPDPEIEDLRRRFAGLFNETHFAHGYYHRIGGHFIRKYRRLL